MAADAPVAAVAAAADEVADEVAVEVAAEVASGLGKTRLPFWPQAESESESAKANNPEEMPPMTRFKPKGPFETALPSCAEHAATLFFDLSAMGPIL